MTNLDRAMKNPHRYFGGSPAAVCDSAELSREQKRAVLTQWKNQLEQEQAADNENMQGEGVPDVGAQTLEQVSKALLRLEEH